MSAFGPTPLPLCADVLYVCSPTMAMAEFPLLALACVSNGTILCPPLSASPFGENYCGVCRKRIICITSPSYSKGLGKTAYPRLH